MSELQELYQEVILDHYKKPRNFHSLENAGHQAEGDNPLCGDKLTVYLKMEDHVIKDISFIGSGCAISTASASLMTESIKGKSIEEAEALFKKFHAMVTQDPKPDLPSMGKLEVFSGVREFPVRVKCATLAWHTLHAALKNLPGRVTTE